MSSSPRGKKTSAPDTTPIVPTMVTMSGVTPIFIRPCATGLKTLVQNWRNRSSIVDEAPFERLTASGLPARHGSTPIVPATLLCQRVDG